MKWNSCQNKKKAGFDRPAFLSYKKRYKKLPKKGGCRVVTRLTPGCIMKKFIPKLKLKMLYLYD